MTCLIVASLLQICSTAEVGPETFLIERNALLQAHGPCTARTGSPRASSAPEGACDVAEPIPTRIHLPLILGSWKSNFQILMGGEYEEDRQRLCFRALPTFSSGTTRRNSNDVTRACWMIFALRDVSIKDKGVGRGVLVEPEAVSDARVRPAEEGEQVTEHARDGLGRVGQRLVDPPVRAAAVSILRGTKESERDTHFHVFASRPHNSSLVLTRSIAIWTDSPGTTGIASRPSANGAPSGSTSTRTATRPTSDTGEFTRGVSRSTTSSREPEECPCQEGGGGLVPGDEEGRDLYAGVSV
jgi:hypothetical protein